MGQGTGLGLSTVYGIVKQTGGFVFAAPGRRWRHLTFAVYLPATTPSASRVECTAAGRRAARLLTGTVLLVEDDRAVRLVVERALQVATALTVVAATDGQASRSTRSARRRSTSSSPMLSCPASTGSNSSTGSASASPRPPRCPDVAATPSRRSAARSTASRSRLHRQAVRDRRRSARRGSDGARRTAVTR